MFDKADSSTFESEIYQTFLSQLFKKNLAGTEICQVNRMFYKNVKFF